jgi:hypothetical protein
MSEQVDGDPEQPRQSAPVRAVETVASLERPHEGLGGEVLRDVRADVAPQKAMDGVEVAVEDHAERLRIVERLMYRFAVVVRRGHHLQLPGGGG